MSTEENKALVQQYYEEIFNQGKLECLEQYLTPDFTEHNPPGGAPLASGLESVRQVFASFFIAFPDRRCIIQDMIAEGNKVATRVILSGTHKGEFLGCAPTENEVSISGIDIVRLQDGKIVEHWGQFDELSLLRQLFDSLASALGMRA